MLETGSKAIDFTLPMKHGNPVVLHGLQGKRRSFCIFIQRIIHRDAPNRHVHSRQPTRSLNGGYRRTGISKDSSASHMKFKEKYELPSFCYRIQN